MAGKDRVNRDSADQMMQESLVAEKYAHKVIRTLRVRVVDQPGKLAEVTRAIGEAGGLLGDISRLDIDSNSILRGITVYLDGEEHLQKLLGRLDQLDDVRMEGVSDNVLEIHRGGKLRVAAVAEIRSLEELQMIYTPGVASVCRRIAANPDDLRQFTWVSNTVAIITDGSAVLGLGNIGPRAALPVMEGKAVILDRLAGVGCVPIILDTQDTEEIIRTIELLSPGFGVIMLEDIAAPKCFEIESRLALRLPMPVFHDDQHGTAIVILAALRNACRRVRAELGELRIVIMGSGAAGGATARLLLKAGARHIICCDRAGSLYRGRTERMDEFKKELAEITNLESVKGSLSDVMKGANVFIGLSSKGLVSPDMVRSMGGPRVVLALANPEPEISPHDALTAGADVALDGRTVNNALAFPGIVRGTLESGAKAITDEMKMAAAKAIADHTPEGLYLPLILDKKVHKAVAEAVAEAARTGISGD